VLLALPAITVAQPTPLALRHVWVQDTGGIEKTTFNPGEAIQIAAQLDNQYGGALLAADVSLTSSFYNDNNSIDIPPGIRVYLQTRTSETFPNFRPISYGL
jgi:hypothetical protein